VKCGRFVGARPSAIASKRRNSGERLGVVETGEGDFVD